MTTAVQPWPADTACPEKDYPAFAEALKQASYHYASANGREWGQAELCMERAADTAINAAWPHWAMQRMYREIAPLPSFDSFMEAYCRKLLDAAAPDLLHLVRQYRSDLRHPPSADSIERRLQAIDRALAKVQP